MTNWNPEKEVPSLELCKKLKELGYPQDGGGWYWVVYHNTDGDRTQLLLEKERDKTFWRMMKNCSPDYREVIKAPTCRELGEWFPSGYYLDYSKLNDFQNKEGIQMSFICDKKGYTWHDVSEANVRAKMLIWLVENGYVKFN